MSQAVSRAREVFQKQGGVLRSSEARRLGVHPQTMSRMLESGQLVRLERGLYRLAEAGPLAHPDLVQVARLVPRAVICLISALDFHELTTQIPNKVYLALPQKVKKPNIAYPVLDVVWLSGDPYAAGMELHRIEGTNVAIYNREKTVADCFKFRNKIGRDVAIEALGDYLRMSDRDIDKLMHYAEVDRVVNVMRPYLEALQ